MNNSCQGPSCGGPREHIREVAATCQAEYDRLASEIVALGRRTNAEALFTVVTYLLSMKPAGQSHEISHGTNPVKVEHMAFHLWPLFSECKNRPFPSSGDMQYCLDTLDNGVLRYVIAFAEPKAEKSRDEGLLTSLMRIHTAMVRGSAFPEQTAEEISGVQEPFSAWFKHKCGITPRMATECIWAIVRAHEAAANALHERCRSKGKALQQQWQQANKKRPHDRTPQDWAILNMFRTARHAQMTGFFQGYEQAIEASIPVSVQDLCATVPGLNETSVHCLIQLIGLTQESRAAMSEPIQVRTRPLYVLPSGRLLSSCVSSTMDSLWEAFEAVAASDTDFFRRQYAPAKGKWLESKVADCLSRVFPKGSIATDLRYQDPDKPTGEAQLDCLVEWGPFFLFCEMKSVRIREPTLLGQIPSLKSDVLKAIARPFEQASRARRFIEQNEKAVFRSADGSEKIIRRDQLSRMYCIAVSQHHLSGLSTDLKMLSCLHGKDITAYPYSVCLADLDVITRFCEVPEVFLHYLIKRLDLYKIEPEVDADEQDIFMAYLASRLLPENSNLPDFDKEKPGGLSFIGWRGDVDVYFQWLRGETDKKPNIGLKVPEEIHLLLRMLRDMTDTAARWIAVSILGFPNETMANISAFMTNLASRPLDESMFRTQGLQAGDITICLCGCMTSQSEEIKDRVGIRTEVEKYRRRTPKAMGVSFLRKGHALMLHTVVWLEGPWEHDAKLEELSNGIRLRMGPGTTLPGRNDLCYCGSGKKFKKCCLPWLQRGKLRK